MYFIAVGTLCDLFILSPPWLLFNANSAIFQLYRGENTLIFNEMMMRSLLYLTNMLRWICIVHWKYSSQIDMSPHSDTLSRFQDNQSLLFLFNAACLARSSKYIYSFRFDLTRSGLEPMIYRTRGHSFKCRWYNTFIQNVPRCYENKFSITVNSFLFLEYQFS